MDARDLSDIQTMMESTSSQPARPPRHRPPKVPLGRQTSDLIDFGGSEMDDMISVGGYAQKSINAKMVQPVQRR